MANTVYPNKVIEAKAKDILTTQINARSMMTIDTSLTQDAGMTKTITTCTSNGPADDVSDGPDNSTRGSSTYVANDYTANMC